MTTTKEKITEAEKINWFAKMKWDDQCELSRKHFNTRADLLRKIEICEIYDREHRQTAEEVSAGYLVNSESPKIGDAIKLTGSNHIIHGIVTKIENL